ncbi:hypothetical protein [Acetobacter oryzoeni]|uniref:Uncharacterized protein n=1 Tax=Acetobacter oryzoeni TaxID=2500548 RepID=A0A5B9GS25_9PROT|nr:hypothetical protein [Acetobacter oryzoeni]MCP1203762.1 hypothetical protein [Acetobacter oryzoeni]QEE86295.1 hypothetical protein EOV40_011650 [Acetobacter oryzoeni]
MSAEHFSLPRTGLDRLIDVWLQMHDVLLPALCVAHDDGPDDMLPFGRPLEGHVLLLGDLLEDFGETLQEIMDSPASA